jgi:CheY-like chemotaxis protein
MQTFPILLVEDDASDAFLLQRAFTKAQVANPLHMVNSGEDALAYLKGEGRFADRREFPFPAIVLLDIKMPRLDGLELLSIIRRDPQLRRLVIIMLSSSGEQRDVDRAFELNANSYLVKPARLDGMAEILETLKNYWLRMNQYPVCPA